MSGRQITSLTNPTVKAVRALHMRKEREESGLFLAEGLKIVIEAIEPVGCDEEAGQQALVAKCAEFDARHEGEGLQIAGR